MTVTTMGGSVGAQRTSGSGAGLHPIPAALTATPRPALPAGEAPLWFVPDRTATRPPKVMTDFAKGVKLFGEAKYKEALPLVSAPALSSTPLASYAAYYTALVHLNLSRAAEARSAFSTLHATPPAGYLSEAAIAHEAEAAVALKDNAGAARLYGELAGRKTASPDALLVALGHAQLAAGDRQHAAETFSRLYYDYPLSDQATVAATELASLEDVQPVRDPAARLKMDFARAERLFGARRYQPARQAFEALQPRVTGDEAEVVGLRLAECDHYMHRYAAARDRLAGYLDHASLRAEAQFFHLTATRELGDHDEYVRLARALVAAFPASSWAEETLNNLATHYILTDRDEDADATFRELWTKFPQGRHAERAAWKSGWWAYKHARYQETVSLYESAAAGFPQSDYRPAYLYWSARAREQSGDSQGAAKLYRLIEADYLNSYYGRLASKRLPAATGRPASPADGGSARLSAEPAAPPPTADLVRLLLTLGMYDQARDELLYAQRTWGDSPAISATLGWAYNRQGDFRRGIIAMKRAYPQYMAADASRLPADALRVVFPLDYWPLIRRCAPTHGLDPFLVAALINQESAFDADVKSGANAIGLMQVLPSTGRRYARLLRLKRFSAGSLVRPETNIQLGTAYFAELVRRFGGEHYALACYNAGEHRVAIWRAERPGLERDEFVDDIPFPETQAYVKKILGSVDDYRRLYADDGAAGSSSSRDARARPPKKAARQPKGGKAAGSAH